MADPDPNKKFTPGQQAIIKEYTSVQFEEARHPITRCPECVMERVQKKRVPYHHCGKADWPPEFEPVENMSVSPPDWPVVEEEDD